MSERPILFSGPMVRALLAGTKTQTRRAIKAPGLFVSSGAVDGHGVVSMSDAGVRQVRCPFGQPGDQLWVRETFAKIDGQTQRWIETDYRASYTHGDRLGDTMGIKKRWTPAIHMPRAASRITLQVTGVRVEQLQAITEVDAVAEGVPADRRCRRDDDTAAFNRLAPFQVDAFPVARYAALWESINGMGSWAANPLVWVVSFSVVRQ